MKIRSILVFLAIALPGCGGGDSDLVGVWKATSVDMSFAKGRIPPEKMDEVAQAYLQEKAPSFDLNSDGTAQLFGPDQKCSGSWAADESRVEINCPSGGFLQLERNGATLTTLPDRTFTFERQ